MHLSMHSSNGSGRRGFRFETFFQSFFSSLRLFGRVPPQAPCKLELRDKINRALVTFDLEDYEETRNLLAETLMEIHELECSNLDRRRRG